MIPSVPRRIQRLRTSNELHGSSFGHSYFARRRS